MKIVSAVLLLLIVSLAGCMSPEERAARDAWEREQRDAYEIYQCQSMGFEQGTLPFGECRLRLREIDAQQQMAQAQFVASQQQTVIVVDDDDDHHHGHGHDDHDSHDRHDDGPPPQASSAPLGAGTLRFVPR